MYVFLPKMVPEGTFCMLEGTFCMFRGDFLYGPGGLFVWSEGTFCIFQNPLTVAISGLQRSGGLLNTFKRFYIFLKEEL